MSDNKPKRPTLPPLQVTETLKSTLEKEAKEKDLTLSPYLVSIIHNRHNVPARAPAREESPKALADALAANTALKEGLGKALKILSTYGEKPKDLISLFTSNS